MAHKKGGGRQRKIPCNLTRCVQGGGVAVPAQQECIILRQSQEESKGEGVDEREREREGKGMRFALSSVFLDYFDCVLKSKRAACSANI